MKEINMEYSNKDHPVSGDVVYKGKIYRVDFFNPIDGYRLRRQDGGFTAPFWVPVKSVIVLKN